MQYDMLLDFNYLRDENKNDRTDTVTQKNICIHFQREINIMAPEFPNGK